MKHHRAGDGERILAVFIDFENLALGFAGRRERFEITKVLERLVEKGKIVAKKAYCDWSRFGAYAGSLHECAIELIEIPKRSMTGKNSADIRLVVDAIDLAYGKDHIDTFVIVSGDSDFSPLVSKLKELGKHVIGLGLQDATSHLLRDNCDEFIYYEDLDRPPLMPMVDNLPLPEGKRKVYGLMMESLLALRRENKDTIISSMIKDTMKRKRPSFNEEYYGYRTFSELLEEAQRLGVLELEKHKTGGSYMVTRFGGELRRPPQVPQLPQPQPMQLQPPRVQQPPQLEERSQPRREEPPRQQPPRREEQRPPQGRQAETRPPVEPRQNEPRPVEPRREEPRPPQGPQQGRQGDRPPQRPPVVVPPKPQPAPPVARTPVPPQTPVRPPQPPASVGRDEEDDDLPTLGRGLIDDVDDFDDDLDTVPSYQPQPRKADSPKPTAKGRSGSPPPASKPRQGQAKSAAKPAASGDRPPRGGSKPASPPPAPKSPPAAKPPAAKPKPKPADDDGFGSGLDD